MSKEAQKHFDRIKTNPVEGDMNWMEWVTYEGNARIINSIELPEDFTEPMVYYDGQWVKVEK